MRTRPIVVALALCSLLAIGCGPTAWEIHAYTAQSTHGVSNGMRDIVREHHRDYMRQAVTVLDRADGETDEAWDARRLDELRAADARWREAHEDWVDAQRTAAGASNAYSNGSYAALRGEADDPSALLSIGLTAFRAVMSLADILRRAGFEDLPELPEGVGAFLGAE